MQQHFKVSVVTDQNDNYVFVELRCFTLGTGNHTG